MAQLSQSITTIAYYLSLLFTMGRTITLFYRSQSRTNIITNHHQSQNSDNSGSGYEEASQVSNYFGVQTFTSMIQGASMPSRNVRNEDVDVEVTSGLNGPPLLENNANSNENFAPPVESPKFNNLRATYAPGRMPALHHSSSSRREVVEQEARKRKRDYPRPIGPSTNGVYDPSFAAKGLPVDPHLRMLKANPNFCNPKANSKGKVMIDLNKPINDQLYDPSFAANGQPVDPFLRMFKENPDFCNTKAGNKGKMMIDLNK